VSAVGSVKGTFAEAIRQTAETRPKTERAAAADHAGGVRLSRRQADDRLLRLQFAIIIAAG
jgi:hypothetical protein